MEPLNEDAWPRLIRPGSRIFIGAGASVPFALVNSMLTRADAFKDVELVHIHGLGETPWIDPKFTDILRTNSFFLTPTLHEAVERGQADYTPCPMSEVASLFENGPLPLDVALVQVSPPDADGWCTLGVSVDVVKSAVKCARMVIAQINPKMPRTCGDSRISTNQIDFFIEQSAALPEMPQARAGCGVDDQLPAVLGDIADVARRPPARIKVEGKAISEAKYKKEFAA